MVSVNDLADFDYFEFRESEYALVGRSTGLRFAMGDKVKVRVAAANLAKRQIDYTLAVAPVMAGRKRHMAPAPGRKKDDKKNKNKQTKRKK
jgi:ribonuclease R